MTAITIAGLAAWGLVVCAALIGLAVLVLLLLWVWEGLLWLWRRVRAQT